MSALVQTALRDVYRHIYSEICPSEEMGGGLSMRQRAPNSAEAEEMKRSIAEIFGEYSAGKRGGEGWLNYLDDKLAPLKDTPGFNEALSDFAEHLAAGKSPSTGFRGVA